MIRKPSWFAADRVALQVDDVGDDAGHRQRAGAGLQRDRAGHRRDHDGAGFGLPPGVDDGAALLADDLVIPLPRRRIDRLADRAEQAQARQIVRVRPLVALADERADRGGRGVENVDAVLLDRCARSGRAAENRARLRTSRWSRRPRAARRRCSCGRSPSRYRRCTSRCLRPADRRPTSWSCGPAAGSRRWCARCPWACRWCRRCRARTADARYRAARRGSLRSTPSSSSCHQWSRPSFMAIGAAGAPVDDHVAHGGAIGERFVDGVLELHFLAAPPAAIGGDDDLRIQILDAGLQRLRRESAEDDAVGDAEARAGQQRDRQLRDHRHVDDGAVAGLEAAAPSARWRSGTPGGAVPDR